MRIEMLSDFPYQHKPKSSNKKATFNFTTPSAYFQVRRQSKNSFQIEKTYILGKYIQENSDRCSI